MGITTIEFGAHSQRINLFSRENVKTPAEWRKIFNAFRGRLRSEMMKNDVDTCINIIEAAEIFNSSLLKIIIKKEKDKNQYVCLSFSFRNDNDSTDFDSYLKEFKLP